jgi:hypothetical protein
MRYNTTERIGVNAVECIIIQELQWIFRDQPIVDVGIDAMIEVVENGIPSCKFIASQIKSGKGNFHEKEKSWSYYTSDIHYNYWLNSNMPVILIAYIPEESTAFWISIEPQNFIRNKRQWRIDIPKKQKLNVHSKRRLLALIEGITIEDNIEKWSIERIKGLNEKVKNISKSARLIDDLTILFKSISTANNLANEKYKVLINLGMNLQSPQTKKVTGELVNSIRSIIPKAEMLINEFSSLFAIGTDALRDLITGCKEHKLEIVLEQILPVISEFSKSSKTPISQITELKNTIDKFSNKDKELKLTATILSEVLSLVIREFSVACNITEDIVEYIKEDSF